ncbi:MAG: UDP-N-acetylglucosamine 2-epimerase (non-hydrolyzing) [Candidatus Zixiibacteriota bacterium]
MKKRAGRNPSTQTTGRGHSRPVVVSVFGTRPQLIKLGAIWRPLEQAFESILIDSGQHYDDNLAGVFYGGRRLRRPDHFLNIRADSPARQIGRIADALDGILGRISPNAVIVYGDTSTTAGAAIAAAYRGIPLAHVEAGLRSFDLSSPEEKNRLIADHLANWLFCPTRTAMNNLKSEGTRGRIFGVGDLLYENFLANSTHKSPDKLLEKFGLTERQYLFVTCHRAETVDRRDGLSRVIDILLSLDTPLVFPVHPRTKRRLIQFGLWRKLRDARHTRLSEPLDHDTTLASIRSARAVLTDSGGVQREACWSGTPCLTLRDRTEWTELVACGANRVVGLDLETIRRSLTRRAVISRVTDPVFRRRKVSQHIVRALVREVP